MIFSFSSSISCEPLAKELLASNCLYRITHGAKHRAVQVNTSSFLGINTTDNIGAIFDSLLGMKTGGSHITVNIAAFLSSSKKRKRGNIRSLLSGKSYNAQTPLVLESQ